MVVKSKEEQNHLKDIAEVFEILNKHKLSLKVAKCAFRVSSGKFLWHLVTRREIEANLEQIVAIKEAQKITGWRQHLTISSISLSINTANFSNSFVKRQSFPRERMRARVLTIQGVLDQATTSVHPR